jgi:hypothetical protein
MKPLILDNFPLEERRREAIAGLSEHTASIFLRGYSTLGPWSFRIYWKFLKQYGVGRYPYPTIRGGKNNIPDTWAGPSDSEPAV